MTTILVLNAASALLAAGGIVGYLLFRARRDRRAAITQSVYVTSSTTEPRPAP
jgi:hypothetical protein